MNITNLKNSGRYILCDDYTGASDVAELFFRCGYQPLIIFSGNNFSTLITETFSSSKYFPLIFGASIRYASFQLLDSLKSEIVNFFRHNTLDYFKIDSTLKGNIHGLIKTVFYSLTENQTRPLILNPGNPDAGRTVKAGKLFINQIPLSRSELNFDPAVNLTRSSSRIKTLTGIGNDSNIEMRNFDFINYSQGLSELSSVLSKLEIRSLKPLFAGSAGLLKLLLKLNYWNYESQKIPNLNPEFRLFNDSKILIITTSLSQNSRIQLNYLNHYIHEFPKSLVIKQISTPEQFHNQFDLSKFLAQLPKIIQEFQPRLIITAGGQGTEITVHQTDIKFVTPVKSISSGISLLQNISAPNQWIMPKPGAFGHESLYCDLIKSSLS